MVQWESKQLLLQVFVRSRETVEAQLPLGRYRGVITCGSQWYGAAKFGVMGSKELVALPFVLQRNATGALQGVTVDLTRRVGGNSATIRP
jgi:hypothetical protein